MPALLGYWKLRGLGHPIRYILEYTGTDYEEKFYYASPGPDYAKEWYNEKYKLGLEFPNLPYYIDGDVKITQSKAILKYIARKHNLVGTTEEERLRIDIMEGVTEDLRQGFTNDLCYNPDFENLKAGFLEALPAKLQQVSDYLGDGEWVAGKTLTYLDFFLYETLDHHRVLAPEVMKKFPKLEKYLERFEKLPKIAAYMASPRFFKNPLNFVTAKFGAE